MNRKLPIATICILLVTGTVTGLQFVFPEILAALRRTPTTLANHEWWRLITPLLVHADGWGQIAFNFPMILVVGFFTERIFGSRTVVIVYVVCGLVGEIAGYAWKPYGAGASVGGAGLQGALAMWMVRNKVVQAKIGGAILLMGGVVLTLMRDLHGPPLLAGAGLAWFLLKRKAG